MPHALLRLRSNSIAIVFPGRQRFLSPNVSDSTLPLHALSFDNALSYVVHVWQVFEATLANAELLVLACTCV